MSAPKASPAASEACPTISGHEESSLSPRDVVTVIDSLKKQVASSRTLYVKKRVEENSEKVLDVTTNLYKLSMERRNFKIGCSEGDVDLLAKRQKDAIDLHNGIGSSNGDNESSSSQEDGYAPSAILLGSSIAVKNAVRPIKLPEVKKLPPYTTWIFLDRNQRMTEDQSVVGRRRIYYDQTGGEALICSDSEEEAGEDEEEKKEFLESENYILRTTIEKVGLSDMTLDLLAQCLSRKPCEIKARYEDLMKDNSATCDTKNGNAEGFVNPYIDKDLDGALDSFDNLFCRRCLVFDCRLHGCSQDLVFPADKQLQSSCTDVEKDPCGPNCYRRILHSVANGALSSREANHQEKDTPASNSSAMQIPKRMKRGKKLRSVQSESASSSEIKPINDATSSVKSSSAGKSGGDKRSSKRIAENALVAKKKRQKNMEPSDSDSVAAGDHSIKELNSWMNPCQENEDTNSQKVKPVNSRRPRRKESLVPENNKSFQVEAVSGASNESESKAITSSGDTLKKEEHVDENENVYKQEVNGGCWKPFEKSLYEKGLQMFGPNSCLIARNLLSGLKNCSEIFKYMHDSDKQIFDQDGNEIVLLDGWLKADGKETVGGGAQRRSKFLRRKGRVRRLKYTWKAAGYQSFRKRISERKDQPCRQYNPCGCQSACGKSCPCLVNGTGCEKYCGCPKSCKNRFRGCHCAKSQCRSRQCPCFAADRECDPDVCRNCWISCGDGTLGVPFQRGDNYECRNMKLLLKQQQKVLLGRSDISGWGAFLKNTVGKHEYLGEYTGELISHREADKRGKIYDRENSSFLFNLNDQFVLDAYRKGDKLKFANHSPDPNCYAKVIMVAGDHRVGIYAKERICAGEELFYDYRYEPDRAPAWAKKPEAPGTKRDDGAPSNGRAKKHI
ncbi:histone-lysine N-methyltransferase CLF-like [Andrographis paniculata]|uniref:histone-lysine N-methyltransferase CLF-like n=1 Tax=Andrographis paniculata TaxID=175694 RepID=UPI0021E8A12D|nr:histone-lysine N-methyltransferase CLF-like [Andrographis paniculata]